MNDYIKSIIKNKIDLIEIENQVLLHKGNLPVLSKAYTFLPPLQEVIVKSIFLTGGLFLSDIKKLLCFSADAQKTERALKTLMQDGHLICKNTPLGKLYGLTGKSISQIRYHVDYYEGEVPNVSDMKLDVENSFTKRKIISSFIADYVFQTQTKELYLQFYSTPKRQRNEYLLQLYMKQISFRNYLKQDETQKQKILEELPLTKEQKESLLSASSYHQKNAEIYATACFKKWGFDELKSKEKMYHYFITLIREECLKTPNHNTFYLLKDFPESRTSEYDVLKILLSWDSNILKHGMGRVWKALEDELNKNTLLYKEKSLEAHNQCIKYLGDERRSLIQKNAYKKQTNEELLKKITEKLAQLDNSLDELRQSKSLLETEFSFPVPCGYTDSDCDWEERTITFKRLQQNSIFLEVAQPKKLIFYVIQTQDDFFELFALHKRLTILFQLYRRIFKMSYALEIKIITLSDEQRRFVESKKLSLKRKLLDSKETSFLGSILEDTLSISTVSPDIMERYHFFHYLYDEIYGGEED